MEMRYHLLTLGCQMNKSDSERVRTVIEGMGYVWTDQEEEASLLGILACSVRQKSINRVYSRISKWNKWRSEKSLLTFVSGCMLPADKLKFLKQFDLVFTMDELPGLDSMIRQYGVVSPAGIRQAGERPVAPPPRPLSIIRDDFRVEGPGKDSHLIKKFWKVVPHYSSPFEAFIPIQNGCDKFCTFCAVPYTRGREVSRSSEDILLELKQLVEKGYKSITLLGQNVNSYGLDKQGKEIAFSTLLRKIGEYGVESAREFWVYFTSPHPRDMTEDVIDTIAEFPCLAKQIHLPVQSGDDRVLIKMNRNHSVRRYKEIVGTIRNKLPAATLFTDIIVGFTGETDVQFENTRLLMSELAFNMAYIAIYSPRPGATSSRWEDDIPLEVKKSRLHILTEELVLHNRENHKKLVGRKMRVLVTGPDRKEGYMKGLTEGKLPVRFPSDDKALAGQFTDIHIRSSADFSLEGDILDVFVRELNES